MKNRRQINLINRALRWLANADKVATPLQKIVRLYDQSEAVAAVLVWEGRVSIAYRVRLQRKVCEEWQSINVEAMRAEAKCPSPTAFLGGQRRLDQLQGFRPATN